MTAPTAVIYRGGYLIEDLAPTVTFEVATCSGMSSRIRKTDALKTQMARSVTSPIQPARTPASTPQSIRWTCCAPSSRRRAPASLPSPTSVIALTAVFPTIVAAAWRRSQGKELVKSRDDLGHAANLLWMMDGKEPSTERARWVEMYLVLLADHGLNASTFTARVIASTGSDLTSCVVGAIGALKGPAHGGATYAARTMLDKIGTAENAEKWLHDAHARGERFP